MNALRKRAVAGLVFGGVLMLATVFGLWWTNFGTRWIAQAIVERMNPDRVEVMRPNHPVHTDVDFSDLQKLDNTGLIFAIVGGALFLSGGTLMGVSFLQYRRTGRF